MRISDWSSRVLFRSGATKVKLDVSGFLARSPTDNDDVFKDRRGERIAIVVNRRRRGEYRRRGRVGARRRLGGARKSGGGGTSASGRVDHGGRRMVKTKKVSKRKK